MDLPALFTQRFSTPPGLLVRAPGAVNLMGEPVDYNQGPALLAAIDSGVQIAAAPVPGDFVRLYFLDLDEGVSFHLDNGETGAGRPGQALPAWARGPAGVAWALRRSGYAVTGLYAVISSQVVPSGLDASAAIEAGFAVLWQALGGCPADPVSLAGLCRQVAGEYLPNSSTHLDPFAYILGVVGRAIYLDTRSLEWRTLPMLPGNIMVLSDPGVRASLDGPAYLERRAECEQAVEQLRQYLPALRSLRDISPQEFAAYSVFLPETLRKRAEHVVKEIARVHSAASALERADHRAFGALMFASQTSLRDLYQASAPELDTLVSLSRGLPGCLGTRLAGAGLGGCTLSLVEEEKAPEFSQGLQVGYHERTGKPVQAYLCRAADGARISSL